MPSDGVLSRASLIAEARCSDGGCSEPKCLCCQLCDALEKAEASGEAWRRAYKNTDKAAIAVGWEKAARERDEARNRVKMLNEENEALRRQIATLARGDARVVVECCGDVGKLHRLVIAVDEGAEREERAAIVADLRKRAKAYRENGFENEADALQQSAHRYETGEHHGE